MRLSAGKIRAMIPAVNSQRFGRCITAPLLAVLCVVCLLGLSDATAQSNKAASAAGARPAATAKEGRSAELTPPALMHVCIAHCFPLRWGNGNYTLVGPSNTSVYTVESFTRDAIVMHRTDRGTFPLTAVMTGKLSKDGNSVVDGKIVWTSGNHGEGAFRAAWGSALSSVPGDDAGREREAAAFAPSVTKNTAGSLGDGSGAAQVSAAGFGAMPKLDVRGEFFWVTGNVYTKQVLHPIRITLSGDRISAVRLVPGSGATSADARVDGEPFMQGIYDANVFTGSLRSAQGAWSPVTVRILNPDHVKIGNTDYIRYTDMLTNDVTCDAQNSQHVNGQFADLRGQIALKANNLDLANCWFRTGALGGYREAQAHYGISLSTGRGMKVDYDQAFVWFKKSAMQGDFDGEYNLSRMYYLGLGTAKDEANAAYWYHVASRNLKAPERMQEAEGLRNLAVIGGSVLAQAFGQSPLCDAPYNESGSAKRQREATVANNHISCGIAIPIEMGPPHP